MLADLITRLHPKWIVNYLEHDSLLQNIESEELTPEEMEAAWVAYEAEKSGQTGFWAEICLVLLKTGSLDNAFPRF